MAEASLDELGRAADRRGAVASVAVPAVLVPPLLWLGFEYGPMAMVWGGIAAWLLVSARIVPRTAAFALATEKPPETVEAEFRGPETPIFVLNRRVADAVEEFETGAKLTKRRLRRSAEFRYEALDPDEVDVEADCDVVVELSRNGARMGTIAVTIESTDEGTRVRGRRAANRITGYHLLVELLRAPLQKRALERLGYEVVD